MRIAIAACASLCLVGALPAAARPHERAPKTTPAELRFVPELDTAFHQMYLLQFGEARKTIAAWQGGHPDEAFGYAATAATFLFEELYLQGVFSSAFFLDDKKFLEGIDGHPAEERRQGFLNSVQRAQDLAQKRLAADANNSDALFTLTISCGMLADYTSLIEKRHLAALKYVREAEDYSSRLLAVQPRMQDAYLALGTANYIIGSLPAYKRFFLRLGGIKGDRARGMSELEQAARDGHYLQPFAKVMLALASLREKQPERARLLLTELSREFPSNPLFRKELDLLTPKISR